MKKKNFLLIIGNGFDLELGLDTSYKSFVKSDIYDKYLKQLMEDPDLTKKESYNFYDLDFPMFEYFKEILKIQNWIDLEMEIGRLASRHIQKFNQYTRKFDNVLAISTDYMMRSFNALRECLNEYIVNLEIPGKKPNYAFELLKIIGSENRVNVQIVNFNYTNLNDITGIDVKVPVHHIHGNVAKGPGTNLILGVQDDIEVDKSYSYVIKSHSPFYRSSRIIDLLEEADEVIFFGHSLGKTDYPYFSEFFQSQCKRIPPEIRKKNTNIYI